MAELDRTNKNVSAVRVALIALACVCIGIGCMTGFAPKSQVTDTLSTHNVAGTVGEDGLYHSSVDWAALKAESDDVIGWITVPDTEISYPIYKNPEGESDYYLHHDRNHDYSQLGEIYLDDCCSDLFASPATILFGHNIKYGSKPMFHEIAMYTLEDWALSHATVWVETETLAYKCQFAAAAIVEGTDKVNRGDFTDQEDFEGWYRDRLADSYLVVNDEMPERVLTLGTCSYHYSDNERTIAYFTVEDVLPIA